MNKNQIYSLWPIYIGEFYNPEHQEIKDDLINFFSEYEKKNPKGREIGIAYNISINKYGAHHPMYKDKPLIFDAFASHIDHISQKPNSSHVLSDNHYSIQSLVSNKFWGTQYHPEFNFKYTGQILNARKNILLKEKLFSNNQIQSLIKDFKRPNNKSYSQSLLKDTLRHKELKNWLSYLRKN